MWKARAFGLAIESTFDVLGVGARRAETGGRRVRLELAGEAQLAACAGDVEAVRVAEVEGLDGRPLASIDSVEGRGFALRAAEFGSAWIDGGGERVLCAPEGGPAWRWQRFLTGQVLPFTAVLQGLEVFHASAVVAGGRAVAIAAPSGSGKSSVALELLLRGLPFLDDDVLAVEADPGAGLVAHPGAAVANVRRDASGLPDRLREAGVADALGATEHETRVLVPRHEEAVPLGALFFLRRIEAGGRFTIERVAPVDPRLLLAATFNLSLRGPDRLARQLDVCGRLAESVPVYQVDCPPAVDAERLAGEILGTVDARPGDGS
jgi:hypothetical protein